MKKQSSRNVASKRGSAGFTLVELMVVIAIIATLATIVGINYIGKIDEANHRAAIAQISTFKTAVIGYKLKFKKLPESLEQLVSEEILDAKTVPLDPWDNPYVYRREGSKFVITCYGADGSAGGTEEYDVDISSDNLSD